MTLRQFQESGGIPLAEQIILLHNRTFFNGYEPLLPAPGRIQSRALSNRLINHAIGKLEKYLLRLPDQSRKIFLGYYNQSFDDLHTLLGATYQLIRRSGDREFELVVGKGDYEVNASALADFPSNLLRLTANNVSVDDSRIGYLPVGRDFRNRDLLSDRRPGGDKTIVCYCNFSLDTHPVRRDAYRALLGKDFVEFQHMGRFLDYPIGRGQFLKQLESSMFCVCPRGNGIDTFRLWDCLYSGTVPIVVREATFHEQLKDLPVLFLEGYGQLSQLTEQYLRQSYSKFLNTTYNFNKLTREYWI
jgi:hypothetical protein